MWIGGDEMSSLDHIKMSKLGLIKLISDVENGRNRIITIGEKSFALQEMLSAHIGPITVTFSSDENLVICLETAENSDGEVSVTTSSTNFDERD